jgi:ATP synthase E chain
MSSIVNQASINYLRVFALGAGVWYGGYRMSSLESLVHQRTLDSEKHTMDLVVEEAKVAYQGLHACERLIDSASGFVGGG